MALNADRSHQVSDRRRRLIVVDEESSASTLFAEFGIRPDEVAEVSAPLAEAGDRLIQRIISRRLWKHWAVITVLTAIGLAVVSLSYSASQSQSNQPGSVIERTIKTIAGLELLVAGQLAILVGWIRARSKVDYRGRYRSWKWFGGLLLTSAFVTLCGLEPLLPGLLADLIQPMVGDVSAAKPALIVVPVTAIGFMLLTRIVPDTGRNRVSQLLILAASIPAVLYLLCFDRTLTFSRWLPRPEQVLVVASHFVFAGTLLHARFVAWVCNDPPLIQNPAAVPAPQLDDASEDAESPAQLMPTDLETTETTEAEVPSIQPVEPPDVAEVCQLTDTVKPKRSAAKTARGNRRKKKYRKAG
jgi:hypothetical protein